MIESLWDRIIAPVPGNDEGHRKDIETLLKVLKRESDLLGLDVDKHVTVEAPRERGPNKNAERIADNVERYMDLADKLVATGGIGSGRLMLTTNADGFADIVDAELVDDDAADIRPFSMDELTREKGAPIRTPEPPSAPTVGWRDFLAQNPMPVNHGNGNGNGIGMGAEATPRRRQR
jgi:hypothetical protein